MSGDASETGSLILVWYMFNVELSFVVMMQNLVGEYSFYLFHICVIIIRLLKFIVSCVTDTSVDTILERCPMMRPLSKLHRFWLLHKTNVFMEFIAHNDNTVKKKKLIHYLSLVFSPFIINLKFKVSHATWDIMCTQQFLQFCFSVCHVDTCLDFKLSLLISSFVFWVCLTKLL